MENKESIDNDRDDFTVIVQTLNDLCEKVCSKTTFDTAICSADQLSTVMHGATKAGIKCDGSSDTGALKPMVALTPSENGCSGTSTIKDGVAKNGMECDTDTDDIVMNDNKSKTCLVGENGDQHHENNNHNLCVFHEETIDEPCNGNKTTQEDQPTYVHPKYYECDIDSIGIGDDDDINKASSPKDNLEKSGKTSSISEECDTGMPVASDNIVSELDELKHGPEHKSSTQSCTTDTHSNTVEFPKMSANEVSQVQNTDGLNDQDGQMSRRRRKKKVKKTRSNKQTPCSSRNASHTPGYSKAQVNDIEFVLSVVQQDLEVIQMSNETATTVSLKEHVNEDNSDDDSDSSSSSSTSDSSSTETNSKSFAENHIEEDEDRVYVTYGPPRTKDEMLLSELPPPLDVVAMADKDQIKQLGKIESIINAEAMVIIKSFPDVPALDSDSILFLDDGCGFGQIFDIFGQVKSPHYCVRFNNEDEIREKNLSVGQIVFYAPNTESMTNFVFVSKLQRVKGSDASWKHDQEPPDELLEYSDDEAESAAKSSKKKANRLKKRNQTQTQEKDTQENVKKQKTPNPATGCSPSTSQPHWRKQATLHQQYQPHQPPPRPFNIRPRDNQTEFYGERFQHGQSVPMQLRIPPRLGPQPMQRLPSGIFYHHQQPQQYRTQIPGPHLQRPQSPAQFRGLGPHIPNPANGPLQHVPLELWPPPQNAGQPIDQSWSPRIDSYPSGQPIDPGQFAATPRWSTVHPPIPQDPNGRPPFYCPPR